MSGIMMPAGLELVRAEFERHTWEAFYGWCSGVSRPFGLPGSWA